MDARSNLRWLARCSRYLAAAGCLLACTGFTALWMRSYVWFDSLYWAWPDGRTIVRIESYMGRPHGLYGRSSRRFAEPGMVTGATLLADDPFDYDYTGPHVLGFQWGKSGVKDHLAVPYWFLSGCTGAAGGLLLLGGWRRFSLRAAMVATTLVAVVLGLSVMATEMAGPYQRLHW
jgi:hypothetical protein